MVQWVPAGIRARVPLDVRHRIAKARLHYRTPTARWRGLPDALIIGAQRSGTSSLFRALSRHPGTAPSFRKEVEYFSRYENRGEAWYRVHFTLETFRPVLRFEATPDYLFHPLAAERAARLVPNAKLVVLLRDPAKRAWSHYRHMSRLGYETLAFDEALAAEPVRCGADREALARDPGHDPKALLRYSYVARGHYAAQLARWFEHFPREQFLVIRSEDLFDDPQRWMLTISDFLDLAPWQPREFENVSETSPSTDDARVAPATAALLRDEFRDVNSELIELIGDTAPKW